ncbi:MAG: GspH/FimT family protein [Acidobacteriota bacterium]|nr:GspH/FimT family protein [Acidobacteriota bacterium]MDH3529076.1 GspH/FimT family protein [Acidobacteriota bacterium]
MSIFRKKRCVLREQGFSALEALIVVLVIGIVVVIAVPNVTRNVELRKLDTYVSTLSSKMEEAKSYAIKHNRTAWLRIDPVNRTTQIQTTDDAGNTVNLGAAELVPARLDIAETTAMEFRFDSMGRLATGSGTVTFQMDGSGETKTKAITVGPSGQIRVGEMLTTIDAGY